MSNYTILGISDDKDFCQCCGKNKLKRVIWIQDNDTQEIAHYGTTCAKNKLQGDGHIRRIRKIEESFNIRSKSLKRWNGIKRQCEDNIEFWLREKPANWQDSIFRCQQTLERANQGIEDAKIVLVGLYPQN